MLNPVQLNVPVRHAPVLLEADALLINRCGMQELHFVASDIALEVIGDFAVVCLLSPKRNFRLKPKSGLSRAISGLPGHAFQVFNLNFSLTNVLQPVIQTDSS